MTLIMRLLCLSRVADVSLPSLPRDRRAKHAGGWLQTGRGDTEEEP